MASDGSAARTGAAATPAPAGPLDVAWTRELTDGAIAGEPRVWKEHVLVEVAVRGRKGPRRLELLRLADGRRTASLDVPATRPLDPCVGDRTVLLRRQDDLALYRFGPQAITLLRRLEPSGRYVSAVVHDGWVYATQESALYAWPVDSAEPRWTCSLEGQAGGTVAVRGGVAFTLAYDIQGQAELVAVDLVSGRVLGRQFAGRESAGRPDPAAEGARLVALSDGVVVHHPRPVETGPLGTTRGVFVAWNAAARSLGDAALFDVAVPVVAADSRFFCVAVEQGEPPALCDARPAADGRPALLPLAGPGIHPEFVSTVLPLTLAGRTLFVGRRSFDIDDNRITSTDGGPCHFRPVPARGTLLVVESPTRLLALRPARRPGETACLLGPAAVPSGTPATALQIAGAVLDLDGREHEGDLTLDPLRTTVAIAKDGKPAEVRPLAQAHLVLDRQGRLLYARVLPDLPDRLEDLLGRRLADDLVGLCREGAKARDPDLLDSLVAEAADLGAPDARLETYRRQAASLRQKAASPDRAEAAKTEARRAALRADRDRRLLAAYESGLGHPRWSVRSFFLEQVLRRQIDHPEAVRLVREAVRVPLPPSVAFDPLEWLPVVGAVGSAEVRLVDPDEKGPSGLTPEQREVGAARAQWRKDLYGLRSGSLLVLASLDRPARIATCLFVGNRVAARLEEVCAGAPRRRTVVDPLTVQLFENAEQFRRLASQGSPSAELGRVLEEMGGLYDPLDRVTRLLLPPGGGLPEGARGRLVRALTRHWLAVRCPLYETSERRPSDDQPGAWAITGLVGFLEAQDWAPDEEAPIGLDPRATCLDVVAAAPAGGLIPWSRLFGMTPRAAADLPGEPLLALPMRWRMGAVSVLDPGMVYPLQCTAAVAYLHAQGGRLREGLLACLRGHVTGTLGSSPGYVKEAFGLSAEDLGARIVRWVKEAQDPAAPAAPSGR